MFTDIYHRNCPSVQNDYIDLKINFFNSEIVNKIAFLRVNIYKFDNAKSKNARTFILEEFYEVKPSNFIRLSNDLSEGKYEIIYGFMLNSDLAKKYPAFHFKKCILKK